MIKKMAEATRGLAFITRYSQAKLINPESVLEHSGGVALISYVMAQRLNSVGEAFPIGQTLAYAIVHDIDEIGTGDIPRNTKYANTEIRSMLNDIANDAVGDLGCDLDMPWLHEVWVKSKSGKAGAIVSLADGLSVLFKVWEESVMFGNLSIIKYAGDIRKMLDKKVDALSKACESDLGVNLVREMGLESFELCDQIETLKGILV